MNITITINTDAESKLKSIRQPEQTNKVSSILDSKTIEVLNLLRKRLDRQSEPTGG